MRLLVAMKFILKNRLALCFILVVLSFGSTTAFSQGTNSIVVRGFDAYRVTGSRTALDLWLKDSAIALDPQARDRLYQNLFQIQGTYGKYQSYQILKEVVIANDLTRVYATLFLERGPVYISFDVYKKISGEVISCLNFSTKAEPILPTEILHGP